MLCHVVISYDLLCYVYFKVMLQVYVGYVVSLSNIDHIHHIVFILKCKSLYYTY